MFKKEFKAALTVWGTLVIPFTVFADQSTSLNQTQEPSGYLPGDRVKEGQLPAGYNASASYVCQDPWNLIFTADYIYWKWQQAMMEVATLTTPTASGASGFLNGSAEVIFQTPSYKSGFQVGLGCDLKGMDDWSLYAEYTWYKNTNDLRTTADTDQYLAVSPILIKHVNGATPGVLLSNDLSTTAHMHFDELDLLLERPFYLGKKLTANFMAGLQALWIQQKFSADGSGLSFISSNANAPVNVRGTFNSFWEQKSWGLGPKFGFDSNWLLGYGIKIMGSISASALFTSYINLNSTAEGSISDINIASVTFNQSKNYNTVNPVAQSSLGLGWGSYFYKNNLHFDLAAWYDFNVFWSQNLIDVLVDGTGSPGNMVLHGLNVQARFDF